MKKVRRSELPVSNPGFQPLYMHAGWKKNERKKDKILKKFKWFKPKDGVKGDLTDVQPAGTKRKGTKQVLKDGVEVKTVVFVPSTRGGVLVRRLRETEETLANITGFGIKFQEA